MKESTLTESSEKASNQNEKLNASQRLELLESLVKTQSNQIQVMAQEIDKLGSVTSALVKRINAIVRSGDEGQQVNSKQINSLLISDAAKELEGKVNFLVEQGVLSLDNTNLVGLDSFVVGREVNSDGEEINPRIQFAVRSLKQEGQDKVLGKKVGDVISGEDGIGMELLQVYSISQQTAQE